MILSVKGTQSISIAYIAEFTHYTNVLIYSEGYNL